MYAETFQVRPWLETPAKWLRWAIQSMSPDKLSDCSYNLGQFWAALAQAKTQATDDLSWSEILQLDSRSQQTLAGYYTILQQGKATALQEYLINQRFLVSPLGAAADVGWINKVLTWTAGLADPSAKSMAAEIADLGVKAQGAAAQFQALANQAAARRASAGSAPGQTGYTAGASQSTGALVRTMTNQTSQQSGDAANPASPLKQIEDWMLGSWFGVPRWAWVAGGTVLLLILTQRAASKGADAAVRVAPLVL